MKIIDTTTTHGFWRTFKSRRTRRKFLKRSFPRLAAHEILVDIVIPVYNEQAVLASSIAKLEEYMDLHLGYPFHITIIDNGSVDRTVEIAKQLAETHQSVRLLQLSEKGRGRALKKAWSDSQASILAYMDVDLSTDLESFRSLIEPLINGEYGVATGSRLAKRSQTKRSLKREVISRCYNRIIKWSMHTRYSDAQCGFKAIRRDAASVLLPKVKDNEWFFDTELLTKAERRGWAVHEVPVVWIEDTDSRVDIVRTARDDLLGLNRLRKEFGKSALYEKPALALALVSTFLLYMINVTASGYANSYYAAAVQAASVSWKALFFGSLDGASFVSVDKPPFAIWLMGLSAKMLGFSSFSMLLPSALAGVVAVLFVYLMVKRIANAKSAFIAAAIMALTPVAVLMFRFNNPDSFLTMFLAASGYTFVRALDNRRPLLWLGLTAVLTGCAFNAKMLQGLILLPVFALVYLCLAQPPLLKRLMHLAYAAVVTAIATLWWAVIVWLIPASSRPYIGSSSNNSIWDLIMGYNGFGRLLGTGQGGGPGGAAPGGMMGRAMGGGVGPGGTGFGGDTGPLRMFNSEFGPNIGWFIPLAIIAALLAFWLLRRAPRGNKQRAAIAMLFGWVVLHAAVFSITSGTIHPYYPVVMAPAIAALVGIGVPYIWKAYRDRTKLYWILPVAVAVTTVTAVTILNYSNTWPLLTQSVLASGLLAAAGLAAGHFVGGNRLRWFASIVALVAITTGPLSYAITTVATAHTGSIPTAGPTGTAGRTNNESSAAEAALVSYLLQNQDGATWVAAVASANESAAIQISTGQPVMAVGGFNGGDNTLTLTEFKQLVADGKLRYYVTSANGRGGGGPGRGNSDILSWVQSAGTVVDYGGSGYTVYELPS